MRHLMTLMNGLLSAMGLSKQRDEGDSERREQRDQAVVVRARLREVEARLRLLEREGQVIRREG